MKTVSFVTLGCKVNQYDSQAMLERFEQAGYQAVPASQPADVCVVNTCTVTGTGDKKSLQQLRRCLRKNPGAAVIAAGCLAQRMGKSLLDLGVRLVIGNQHRGQVVELLEQALRENTSLCAVESLEAVPYERLMIHSHEGFTRAVMKIQEGCDNHCTYCIIPSVRGGIRSRSLEDIQAEARELAQAGFQEIVLTGIHLTSYGRDLPEKPSFADAVKKVCETEGIFRVRLGSLEPRVATETFARELSQSPKVCPQFHLALQSGSDSVLRRMKRAYNTEQFRLACERIRRYWPDTAFTTDVIVGFPGETEEEFQETLDFCREIGFAKIHVFPFSPREGTPAAGMEEQCPESLKAQRVHRLLALGEELRRNYCARFLGRVAEVLFEEPGENGLMMGYTPEYIPVYSENVLPGKRIRVVLTEATEDGILGMPIQD